MDGLQEIRAAEIEATLSMLALVAAGEATPERVAWWMCVNWPVTVALETERETAEAILARALRHGTLPRETEIRLMMMDGSTA